MILMHFHRVGLLTCLLVGPLVGLLVATTACQPQVPVEEVSLQSSGLAVTDLAMTLGESDWASWRGPSQIGSAGNATLTTTWSDDKNIVWRSPVAGRGHGSPIVVGEGVYLATALDREQKILVLAYDRSTGAALWERVIHQDNFPAPGEVHSKATNANTTLASDGERLYSTQLNNRRIHATALSISGEVVWQTDVGAFQSMFGYAASPLIYKSLVIVIGDSTAGGYVAALDRVTGEVVWRVQRGSANSYSTPIIVTAGGVDSLVVTGDDQMAAYDPTTGQRRWSTPCISKTTCGTIVTDGERLFASGGYPDNETVCVSVTGERLWANNSRIYEPSMLVVGEHLFAVTDDGIAMCWSAADGDQKWKKRLGGNFSASPIVASGNIYAMNLSGETFVFEASGEKYKPIAKNRLGDDCYASPAVSNDQLFLRIGRGTGEDRAEELVCVQ